MKTKKTMKKNEFLTKLSALYVLYKSLDKNSKIRFLKAVRDNSYKKVFKNEKFSIINIDVWTKNPKFFYYHFKRDNNYFVLLKASDLDVIRKNINYLITNQKKQRC